MTFEIPIVCEIVAAGLGVRGVVICAPTCRQTSIQTNAGAAINVSIFFIEVSVSINIDGMVERSKFACEGIAEGFSNGRRKGSGGDLNVWSKMSG